MRTSRLHEMIQRAVVLFACAAFALGGCAGQSTSGRPDANLREVAGEPDRGWGYLAKSAHTREKGDDRSRDVCDTVAANGASFDSNAGRVAWLDEAGALTETELHSSRVSEPGLLLERRSLTALCFDDSD
jgi:hypothetical protein